MITQPPHILKRRTVYAFFSVVFLTMISHFQLFSQEMPPRPDSVFFIQNMSFGAFSPGSSGGAVTVTSDGLRFATGSVMLVNMGYLYFPAIFGLSGNPGSIAHLLNGPDATLTGNNGGTMTLQLGSSTPGDPIILNSAPPGFTEVRIGGILTVGNQVANPAGFYSGTFTIMFIQE